MACLDSRFGDGLSPLSVCVFVATVAAEEHHDRQSYSGQSCQNARIRTLYSRAFASILGLKFSVDSLFESHSPSVAVLLTLWLSPSPNLPGLSISPTLYVSPVSSPPT